MLTQSCAHAMLLCVKPQAAALAHAQAPLRSLLPSLAMAARKGKKGQNFFDVTGRPFYRFLSLRSPCSPQLLSALERLLEPYKICVPSSDKGRICAAKMHPAACVYLFPLDMF